MTKDFIADLKSRHDAYAAGRRAIIEKSSVAQHAAKRAIFAAQRGDVDGVQKLISEASDAIAEARKAAVVNPRLSCEGSLRAAMEEYAEAATFIMLLENGQAGPIDSFDEETLIGGLCDAVGELVRMMIILATSHQDEEVARLKGIADEVVGGLNTMDFSGYLRTKFDQAKNHLRKAEEVMYDVSLRGRSRA